jgi:Cu/Ag efflux protein CusF
MSKSLVLVALLAALPVASSAAAQTPKPVTKEAEVTATATIKAIDPATRSVTLRTENGDEDTFTVGPAVTRFNQLKVGDTLKVSYYESLVFQVKKPGAPSTSSATSVAGGRMQDRPGGAIGKQQTTSVTVKAVDMNVPSITVTTADGRTLTRKIADKKNLEGVKVGDQVQITYTQALAVSVTSPQ